MGIEEYIEKVLNELSDDFKNSKIVGLDMKEYSFEEFIRNIIAPIMKEDFTFELDSSGIINSMDRLIMLQRMATNINPYKDLELPELKNNVDTELIDFVRISDYRPYLHEVMRDFEGTDDWEVPEDYKGITLEQLYNSFSIDYPKFKALLEIVGIADKFEEFLEKCRTCRSKMEMRLNYEAEKKRVKDLYADLEMRMASGEELKGLYAGFKEVDAIVKKIKAKYGSALRISDKDLLTFNELESTSQGIDDYLLPFVPYSEKNSESKRAM